jgi:hypothetical protein
LPPPLKHAGGRPPKLQVVGESDAPRSIPAEIETVEQVVDAALIIPRPELPPAPVQGTGAAAWRRLCNSNAELVGEMCLHFHKTSHKATELKYKSILGGLGFGFPKQSTLSEWKKRVMKNEPPRGVPGGNRVAILSEAERNHLMDAIYGIGNDGAKVGLKLVRRLTTAILAVSGKAYISGGVSLKSLVSASFY